MQSVWKKMFCGCGSDEGSDQSKKSRSIQQNVNHYSMKRSISRSKSEIYHNQPRIAESAVTFQLKSMNEQNYSSLELIPDNTQTMCFLIQKTHYSIQEKQPYSYRAIFDVVGDKKMKIENIKLAPAKLSQYIATKLKGFSCILEVNSQFGQHTYQFINQGIRVLSFCSNPEQARMLTENLKELQMKPQQYDLVLEDFGKLKHFSKIAVDAVFLNLSHMTKKMEGRIQQELLNSFRVSSNVIVLLANSKIDFLLDQWTQIICDHPEIWYFFFFNQSTSIALTKEEIFINQKQEFIVVYIGRSSNLNKTHLVEALYERLYVQGKSYKNIELKGLILPMLHDLVEKVGCVKIMKYFLHSISLFNSQMKIKDELLDIFFHILEKERLLNQQILEEVYLKIIQYASTYPIKSNQSISPDRKPQKHHSNLQQQTFSFSYDIQQDPTQLTDFMMDGGTYFSTNNISAGQQK